MQQNTTRQDYQAERALKAAIKSTNKKNKFTSYIKHKHKIRQTSKSVASRDLLKLARELKSMITGDT